jgi:hypothetical protein
MVVKILSSGGSFSSVRYNTNKVDTGKGELMSAKNIPSMSGTNVLSPEEMKNFFKSYSSTNSKVKKSQFHCAISCQGREYSKENLTDIAHKYMAQMGYEKQPYLIVFHNDTENNHVHIISSRIDENGKKINSDFEYYRAKKAIDIIMEKDYNVKKDNDLKDFFDYKFSNVNQLKVLLVKSGFTLSDENSILKIYKNGDLQKEIEHSKIELADNFSEKRNEQIRALILKYSKEYSKNVFPIYEKLKGDREGRIIGYESPLTKFLKSDFGLEFVFHFSEDKKPFGYTVLDNKNKTVLKGSDIFKIKALIGDNIEKRVQETKQNNISEYNSYNIKNLESAKVLSKLYKIPLDEININTRVLTENEIFYYNRLFSTFFDINDWSNIYTINVFPVIENNTLYLVDKLSLNIVLASDVLEQNIINKYLENRDLKLPNDDKEINNSGGFGWSLANDVDDEKTHGNERNKKDKKR